MRRPRELGLRARLLWLTVLVVTAGLAAGGILLVGVLNYALLRAVNTEALETANGVVALVNQRELPEAFTVNPNMQAQVVTSDASVFPAMTAVIPGCPGPR